MFATIHTTRRLALLSLLASLTAAAPACKNDVETDEEALCGPYDDQAAEAEVLVRVHNQGTEPIYLGGSGCGTWIDLLLADAQGTDLTWRVDSCTFTCEELRREGDFACAAGCAMPPTYMVAPGGYYETSWSGTYLSQEPMPSDCYGGVDHPTTCQQQIVAPAGSYSVTVNVWDQVSCDVDPCTCTPDAQGSCPLDYAWSSDTPRQASATVSYPDELGIDIYVQ